MALLQFTLTETILARGRPPRVNRGKYLARPRLGSAECSASCVHSTPQNISTVKIVVKILDDPEPAQPHDVWPAQIRKYAVNNYDSLRFRGLWLQAIYVRTCGTAYIFFISKGLLCRTDACSSQTVTQYAAIDQDPDSLMVGVLETAS